MQLEDFDGDGTRDENYTTKARLMNITDLYLGDKRVSDHLKESLGLDNDYIQPLLNSDDWTMMILSWALLEACLNFGITKKLGNESLTDFVEQLNIGGKNGKANLALSLGAITKAEYNFITTYSSVRNRFAHGVKRFKTTFDDYFSDVTDLEKYENALFWKEIPDANDGATNFKTNKRFINFVNVIAVCLNLIRSE